MIHVTFPDGASRPFEPGVFGLDIAKSARRVAGQAREMRPALRVRAAALIRPLLRKGHLLPQVGERTGAPSFSRGTEEGGPAKRGRMRAPAVPNNLTYSDNSARHRLPAEPT